jgi:DNA-binding IclR family transcriptional regulator
MTDSADNRETGTLKRVLMVLGELAEHPGASAAATAQRLNLPRSTVHRLLSMLRDCGFASQAEDGGFAPGAELYRLAGRVHARVPHAQLALPLLQRLSARFHETSVLALLSPESLRMYFAATAAPQDPMRYNLELHRSESLAWGATGRVLLAHLSPHEVDAVIRAAEASPAGGRPLDAEALRAELPRIRADGFDITHGHRTPNAVGVAVPFFDDRGRVVGDFALLIPDFRFERHRREELVQALRECAQEMSARLGHAAA